MLDLSYLAAHLARLVSAHAGHDAYRYSPEWGDRWARLCACGWSSMEELDRADLEAHHEVHVESVIRPYLLSIEVEEEGRADAPWTHAALYPYPLAHRKYSGSGPEARFLIKCEGCEFRADGVEWPEEDFLRHLPACPLYLKRVEALQRGSEQ